MSRFRILLQGDVQQVGFREFVKKVSQKFQAKGCVRNLDDGSVEIYCELANGKLEAYIQNLKAGPGIVEQILIFDESTAEFGIPPTDFTKFKVLRDEDEIAETLSVMTSVGMKMLAGQEQMLQKQDLTLQKLDMIAEKIDAMHADMNKRFDALTEKIDAGNKMLAEKIDSMHADMNERFDRIEAKYGVLSETLVAFMGEFKNFNEKLDEHNRKLDLILERLVAIEERKM